MIQSGDSLRKDFMSAKKVVTVTKRAADITTKEEIQEVAAPVVEEVKPEIKEPVIPHLSELYTMVFRNDHGNLFGVRRGMKLGTIELYEKRSL